MERGVNLVQCRLSIVPRLRSRPWPVVNGCPRGPRPLSRSLTGQTSTSRCLGQLLPSDQNLVLSQTVDDCLTLAAGKCTHLYKDRPAESRQPGGSLIRRRRGFRRSLSAPARDTPTGGRHAGTASGDGGHAGHTSAAQPQFLQRPIRVSITDRSIRQLGQTDRSSLIFDRRRSSRSSVYSSSSSATSVSP